MSGPFDSMAVQVLILIGESKIITITVLYLRSKLRSKLRESGAKPTRAERLFISSEYLALSLWFLTFPALMLKSVDAAVILMAAGVGVLGFGHYQDHIRYKMHSL